MSVDLRSLQDNEQESEEIYNVITRVRLINIVVFKIVMLLHDKAAWHFSRTSVEYIFTIQKRYLALACMLKTGRFSG